MAGLRIRGIDVAAPSTTVIVDHRNRARPKTGDFLTLRSRQPVEGVTRVGSVRVADVPRCFADAATEPGIAAGALPRPLLPVQPARLTPLRTLRWPPNVVESRPDA